MAKSKRHRSKDSIRLICSECSAASHVGPHAMPHRKPLRADAVQELVSRLYEEIVREECAVFVGAGCTTEGGRSSQSGSFYTEILAKSKYPSKMPAPPFPDLMQYFCEHMDGGQHNRLIREAISRIERFTIVGDDHVFATMFGTELAEVPYFSRFVTTNWDPFLERSLDILISMVEDRDIAFWDDRKRQVLKIHGCITRPYSLVATKVDYDACLARNPLIFNKLRDLMATKTFIFIGYSLRDPDFREIWESITKPLGRFAKLAYAVDPNASPEDVTYWKERGIEIFDTSDLAFVRELRSRLEQDGLVASRALIDFLRRERSRITRIHVRLGQTSDGAFASAMYQDGLLHALDDILIQTSLGTRKKGSFESDLSEADSILLKMWEREDPIEIAYWTGRKEATQTFCSGKNKRIPTYIHPYRFKPSLTFVRGNAWSPDRTTRGTRAKNMRG